MQVTYSSGPSPKMISCTASVITHSELRRLCYRTATTVVIGVEDFCSASCTCRVGIKASIVICRPPCTVHDYLHYGSEIRTVPPLTSRTPISLTINCRTHISIVILNRVSPGIHEGGRIVSIVTYPADCMA